MDIAAISTGLAMNDLRQQAGIAVLGKALDTARQDSQAIVQMAQSIAQPHLGGNLDVRV
ncbi:YjfB family protein [Cohnella ginsengisoli]|uniref:YjfB family protein n=1 Tax=Cohnella ginsengisoli TaxID=425004 RepID=A0A9X4QP02_9BACL|nr:MULTISPECIES: YjfB family protein [Cohnella]MDG0792155.1 YjfB family protein [Cohnella ginsengisoli]SFA73894.1 Putative motility protein [Cohnella sp. OV330]